MQLQSRREITGSGARRAALLVVPLPEPKRLPQRWVTCNGQAEREVA
jgi:hypothetical protein